MLALTKFDLTYGAALAPSGYHRVTTVNGGSASIVKDGPTQVYLWHENGGVSKPITEVKVVYGTEEIPEGFEKCPRDMAKGTGFSSFLCWDRGEEKDPLGEDLCIAYGEENPGEDYEKVERSLIPEGAGEPVFLYFKRTKETTQKWTARSLAKGDLVDAKDTLGTWRVAEVIEIDSENEKLIIHYTGWPSKWDEDIRMDSTRLAPAGKHTAGQAEVGIKVQGQYWDVLPEDVEGVESRVLAFLDGQFVGEEATRFWTTEIPLYIEKCLTSQFLRPAAIPKVNKLMRTVLRACADCLNSSEPLETHIMQMLCRIANSDPRCSWFYSKYGIPIKKASAWGASQIIMPEEEEDEDSLKKDASKTFLVFPKVFEEVSMHYISNMNCFGRCGGFEGILSRIDPERQS